MQQDPPTPQPHTPQIVDGVKPIAVRDMMYLSLSYDHRLIDGAVAVSYTHLTLPTILLV